MSLLLLALLAQVSDVAEMDVDQRLYGKWEAVEVTYHGEKMDRNEIPLSYRRAHWVFGPTGYEIVFSDVADPLKFSHSVFSDIEFHKSVNHYQGDIAHLVKGSPVLAIYKIDGDTMVRCYDTDIHEFPKEFSSKPGSTKVLVKMRRVK